MAMWNTFSGPVSRRRYGRIRTERRVATKGWRRRTGQEHFATCRRSKSDPHALPETAAQIDMTGSRSLNLDRPAYRGGPAKPEKRKDNRAGRRTRSRRKSKPKRAQIDEKTSKNSTKNRRKVVLGQFRAIKNHSEAAREAPERPRSAKKSPRDRSWEPADGSRTVSETSGERPEGSRDALGTTPGAVRTRPWRRALSKCLPDRIFVVFVSSRESSDVLRVPRFTVFCCSWTKKATNGREGRRSSKKQGF